MPAQSGLFPRPHQYNTALKSETTHKYAAQHTDGYWHPAEHCVSPLKNQSTAGAVANPV